MNKVLVVLDPHPCTGLPIVWEEEVEARWSGRPRQSGVQFNRFNRYLELWVQIWNKF